MFVTLKTRIIARIAAPLAFFVSSCVTPDTSVPNEEEPIPPGYRIHLWTRANGRFEDHRNHQRVNEKVFDWDKNKLYDAQIYDLQYDQTLKFKGLWLNDVLAAYPPDPQSDMILLHFRNKIMIPVPLSTAEENAIRKRVFVAFRIQADGRNWTTDIPDVVRTNDRNQVVRRLRFDVNKIVVSSPQHPFLESAGGNRARRFSPWRYANDLVGVEFVNQSAWDQQFFAGPGQVAAGQDVFLSRCQYCHSVRGVGSERGWDFAGPVKIYKKRNAESLYYHVKYPKAFAAEYGISMPTQPTFTEKEADDLWEWLRAIAKKKHLEPYVPVGTN